MMSEQLTYSQIYYMNNRDKIKKQQKKLYDFNKDKHKRKYTEKYQHRKYKKDDEFFDEGLPDNFTVDLGNEKIKIF